MRLTDTCTIRRNGTLFGPEARRCEFGHVGAGREAVEQGRVIYAERARVIVGPDPELAAVVSPSGYTLEHKGREYRLDSILPRYRPGGRLHHISLDLEQVTG